MTVTDLTFEQALELLGIGPDAGRDGARRAYLRRLKRCKPERDPEGFMRLRRAYELVIGQIAWYAPVDEEEPPAQTDSDHPAPDQPLPSAPMIEVVPDDPGRDVDPYYRRMEELGEQGTVERRIAIAREAVQEHPEDAGAHWMLIYELQDADRTEELTAALREAHQRGLPGFTSMLLSISAETLTDEEITQIRATDDPELRIALPAALVRRGEVRQGVELANEMLAEVETGGETYTAIGVYPAVLDLILDLHQRDHVESASALTRRIDRSLQETGEELRFATFVNVSKWMLIQELAASSGALDPPLRRGLVQAIREGALEGEAQQQLRAFTRWHRSRVSRVAAQISPDAPNLSEMLNGVIDEVARRRQRNRSPVGVNRTVWIAAIAAIAVSNLLFRQWSHDKPDQVITPQLSEQLRKASSRLRINSDARLFAVRLEALCAWARTDAGARQGAICGAFEALRSRDRARICPALASLHDAIRGIEAWPGPTEIDVPWATLNNALDFLPKVEQEQQRHNCESATAATATDAAPASERTSD